MREMVTSHLKCLQRQKAKVGQEKSCCLELLRGRRGFALRLRIWEMLGLPDVVAVPFQGVLILDLLGHQNSKFVMLHFQL